MIRVLLICSAGMSTSMLVAKMRQAAEKQGIEAEINAVGESQLSNYVDKIDALLLGPQVRFLHNKIKTSLEPKGIPVEVINNMDYGTMNGEKVLKQAIDMVNNK
ncbi:PTS sugar transporter subunit IIB [Desnuesiella massiliensis]|uniref:PTS sugar transporter subunit IIB n=1 Tax=Desnuesiella massiliensis TaxID=1650662 RepID=UPI0006E233A7|nr:PTS sugar transporter subunit IIB [Desnuesiella massiliensis]